MMTKNKTAAKNAKKTEDQSVVYKVPAAFALMILVVYAFWRLGGYYSTVEGFTALYPLLCTLRYVFAALSVVLAALCIGLKARLARTLCAYGLTACVLLFVSSLTLSIFWTGNMIAIYLLHALVYCLYMVWQLYRSEFFTFSLVTATAGVVFFLKMFISLPQTASRVTMFGHVRSPPVDLNDPWKFTMIRRRAAAREHRQKRAQKVCLLDAVAVFPR